MEDPRQTHRFWNPYAAGVALGLVLLTAFVITGRGLGASGTANRVGVTVLDTFAPGHVAANPYFRNTKAGGAHPLDDWVVFMTIGTLLGGFVSAYAAGRFGREVIRGPSVSVHSRMGLALAGGVLMGIGARLSLGCTSGQALTGGSLLSVGSWIFMLAVFAGGYALAPVVRRQWL